MKVKFQKSFTKLPISQKKLVTSTVELFVENPMHESLRNHPLRDKWVNYRSITADGDLRLHYRVINKDIALFVAVGTHKELYQ
jgi:addiction module RelE/StbE family toxin